VGDEAGAPGRRWVAVCLLDGRGASDAPRAGRPDERQWDVPLGSVRLPQVRRWYRRPRLRSDALPGKPAVPAERVLRPAGATKRGTRVREAAAPRGGRGLGRRGPRHRARRGRGEPRAWHSWPAYLVNSALNQAFGWLTRRECSSSVGPTCGLAARMKLGLTLWRRRPYARFIRFARREVPRQWLSSSSDTKSSRE